MRDERFTPIAERAVAVWKQLRLQSHVDLGGIEPKETGQRRRVALQVTVDGSPAEALGVMSQGELHSLALSLFLPRATLPESPFRFISIDHPVQSMDPARVEGLARVLADAARTRQVIVFTHDDPLPEAVRRLEIPATVLSVTRRARSSSKSGRHQIRSAACWTTRGSGAYAGPAPSRAAARGSWLLPHGHRNGLHGDYRLRWWLLRGESHDDVETLLGTNARAPPPMALALFDDEKKTEDVVARLKKMGPWAVEMFKCCKAGAHDAYDGDLADSIREHGTAGGAGVPVMTDKHRRARTVGDGAVGNRARNRRQPRGLWPRAAVLLTRQSLEVALKNLTGSWKAPGTEECSTRRSFCVSARTRETRTSAVARTRCGRCSAGGSHVHPYELSPTREELRPPIETVREVVEKTERGWR